MHDRAGAFRPNSIVNVSALSYGALGTPALEALNMGAREAGCWQNTGEGGLTEAHAGGADIVFQIGTGYFGCRDADGNFSMAHLLDTIARAPVKMLEVKLSQGAKPGHGGILPAVKVTPEVARHRGVTPGVDSVTPARHSAFHDVPTMIEFIERLAAETGLPVGIKSAVGQMDFWDDLARAMSDDRSIGPDFVTIDGGEGGTGAAPLLFQDNGALPFRLAFSRVYKTFALEGLVDDITFIGGGKLGLPDNAMVAYALGVDMVNVAREAMMSIGCIQAQKCHTDKCPTGIATQNQRLASGLDTSLKSVRLANYVDTLRRELLKVSEAVGVLHPSLIDADDIEVLLGVRKATPLRTIYGYQPKWGRIGSHLGEEISAIMRPTAPEHTSVAPSVTAQG
jgi:glutamate synthase domain-containing protein 2